MGASLSQILVEGSLGKSEEESLATNAAPSSVRNKEACLQLLNSANDGKVLVLKKALTTYGQPGV
jgi:hypothetical protein